MKYFYTFFVLAILATFSIFGFRGEKSAKPPFIIFPDMDNQSKFKPQGSSPFFADGRTDRLPVPGTVARGFLKEDDHAFLGKVGEEWARGFPMAVDQSVLDRGRAQYGIYCAVCHGGTGDGNGVTKPRGMLVTPSFHDDRLRDMAEGEIFNTLTNGKGLMGYYRDKLSAPDRWAVIAYMRVLQRSRNGTIDDVPPSARKELGL